MMEEAKVKAICPFWNKTCEEVRKELQAQGADCGLVTKMLIAVPSSIIGAPPTMSEIEICLLRSLQQSLNSLHEGLGLVIQLLKQKGRPTSLPFGS